MALVTVRGRHLVSQRVSLDAVLFFRPATIRSFNGDDTAYDECQGADGLLCDDEGEGDPVVDQFGRLVAVDDDDPYDATNNTSKTRTRGWGASLQATVTGSLAARANHLVTGVSIDAAGSRYESDTELARLTADRGTAGTGILDAGAAVRLLSDVRHVGVYAADFWSLSPRLTLMGAARFTHSEVDLRDQVDDDLTGTHMFSRVDPSAGMTFEFGGGLAAFGSFGQASRVPAPSELSCADPEDPCRLPNAFVADPPLDPVVARTWEGGARGRTAGVSWTAAAFRTANRDDLLFVSSGALTNHGHFENVGGTVRRGLELMAAGAAGAFRWSAAYTFLRATFETPVTLASPNHPDAADGEIAVRPGDPACRGTTSRSTCRRPPAGPPSARRSVPCRASSCAATKSIGSLRSTDRPSSTCRGALRCTAASASSRASPTSSTRRTRRLACSATPMMCSERSTTIRVT
jgi:outer membrane receptor protein involved in Fe transport